jgi:hypothetical protein
VACFGDCGLSAVLGIITIRTSADHEGCAGGLRGDYCFVTDFHAPPTGWDSLRRSALRNEDRNDFLEK